MNVLARDRSFEFLKNSMEKTIPPVSVITVTFNALSDLEKTVDSVLRQPAWPELEYIIIDGASSDGTVDYLRTLPSEISWISEPDRGIYDAMNKGIRQSHGKGLLFLNAGDLLVGDVITGDISVPCFLPVRYRHPVLGYRNVFRRSVKQGLPNCHQGIIFEARKGVDYDLRYRICSDYDYYVRHGYGDVLPDHHCSGFVHFDNGGINQKQAALRDKELSALIRLHFGWLPAAVFSIRAYLKRIVRPLLVSVFHHA